MRVAFIIIVIIHALIHLLGFIKAFDIAEIKALSITIGKFMGIIWLLAAFMLLIFGVAYWVNAQYSWAYGFAALIISQAVIIFYWPDAKYGTVPNIIILLVVLVSFGHYRFQLLIEQETATLLENVRNQSSKTINGQDLEHLPLSVQKWLKKTGTLGKPSITYSVIKQKALMKMKPNQESWYHAEALQYSIYTQPAFIWTVDLSLMPLVSFTGRDKLQDGKGKMLIKLNALVNIVNEHGQKIDEGALQRYLGEMVWAPSLALHPSITWEELDAQSARATIKTKQLTTSGIFYFSEQGDFIQFVAQRYMGNTPDATKYPWVLTVDNYATFEGITIPSKMKATWQLPEGNWTWLDLEVVSVEYHIPFQ